MAKPSKSLSQALAAAKAEALRKTALYLDTRFTDEISAVKWEFPTPPQVRDIVDTGRLRASQNRRIDSDGSVTFTWPVEYAAQVHEGGVGLNGQPFPGRPWTKAPLQETPEVFGAFFRRALEGQK